MSVRALLVVPHTTTLQVSLLTLQLADAKAEVELAVLGRMREEQEALDAEHVAALDLVHQAYQQQVA